MQTYICLLCVIWNLDYRRKQALQEGTKLSREKEVTAYLTPTLQKKIKFWLNVTNYTHLSTCLHLWTEYRKLRSYQFYCIFMTLWSAMSRKWKLGWEMELIKIFLPNRKKLLGGWRKLHKAELHFHSTTDGVRVNWKGGTRRTRHVSQGGCKTKVGIIVVWKEHWKKLHGLFIVDGSIILRRFIEVEWEGLDGINLAQGLKPAVVT